MNENDDLWYAFENNDVEGISSHDIADIVAEVPGANDEYSWYWIVKLNSGKFALMTGWCDYTGWDCQSGLYLGGTFDSALLAAESAPEVEEYSERHIRKNLVGQVNGEYPKFTYWSD